MRKEKLARGSVIAIAMACIAIGSIRAQYRGPQDYPGIIKIPIQFPANYPPIRPDMPTDVLYGYVYLDSLVRAVNVPSGECDSLINTVGWDTLKYAIKYLYEMSDYDPIAFFQETHLEPSTPAYQWTSPEYVVEAILRRAVKLTHDKIAANLTRTDAILDVSVIDTETEVDTTLPSLNKILSSKQNAILDIIKGQQLFPCSDTTFGIRRSKNHFAASSQGCIYFEYWLHWQKNIVDSDFVYDPLTYNNAIDSTPWLKSGHEYIVFLNFDELGYDSSKSNDYISITPGFGPSTLQGMYPVKNGIVEDPNNDFGFGTGLTVDEFKAKLRAKIQTITNL